MTVVIRQREGKMPTKAQQLDVIVAWFDMVVCPKCGYYHCRDHRRYQCGYDRTAPEDETPCPKCGGAIGHRVNCPDGISFSNSQGPGW